MFQNFLEGLSGEAADQQLQTMKAQLKSKIDKAKQVIVSCKVGRYEESQFSIDESGQLILPQYMPQISYNEQFWKKYLKNQINFAIIKELSEKIGGLQQQINLIDGLSEEYHNLYRIKNRKKNRRMDRQIQKSFQCPYDNCYKIYGSDVSLNLHIKLKHGGGNKTDRQQLAEQICLAQVRGDSPPAMRFNLPKGFLEEYRISFVSRHERQQEDGLWLDSKKLHLRPLVKIDPAL